MIAVENSSVCFLGHFEEMPFCVRLAQAVQQLDPRGIEFITAAHYTSCVYGTYIRYVNSRQP